MFTTDIILTHFHPDHVAGLPILLLDLLISGKDLLNIYGLGKVIDQAVGMLELFEWQDWGDFSRFTSSHPRSSVMECVEH